MNASVLRPALAALAGAMLYAPPALANELPTFFDAPTAPAAPTPSSVPAAPAPSSAPATPAEAATQPVAASADVAAPAPVAAPAVEPAPAPRPAVSALKYQAGGAGVEVTTSGLLTGELSGGLLVGMKSDDYTLGIGINFASTSLTKGADAETSAGSFSLAPGVRFILARSGDERAELFGQVDAGLMIASESAKTAGGESSTDTSGFFFRAGPGVRYWLDRHIAVGYTALVQGAFLSGTTSIKSGAETLKSDDASSSQFRLMGAFHLLGVF